MLLRELGAAISLRVSSACDAADPGREADASSGGTVAVLLAASSRDASAAVPIARDESQARATTINTAKTTASFFTAGCRVSFVRVRQLLVRGVHRRLGHADLEDLLLRQVLDEDRRG